MFKYVVKFIHPEGHTFKTIKYGWPPHLYEMILEYAGRGCQLLAIEEYEYQRQ